MDYKVGFIHNRKLQVFISVLGIIFCFWAATLECDYKSYSQCEKGVNK